MLRNGMQFVPDVAQMIDDLLALKISTTEIAECMCGVVNTRIIHHYRRGKQPLHWRGENLVNMWIERTGRTRESMPMMLLDRGRRRDVEETPTGPRVQSLPNWPPVQAVSRDPATPVKRGPGRPRKVAA